jgi:hypothetical protein
VTVNPLALVVTESCELTAKGSVENLSILLMDGVHGGHSPSLFHRLPNFLDRGTDADAALKPHVH